MGKSATLPGSQTPQSIKHFRVQSSAWGGVIPLVYGEARVAGNIVTALKFGAVRHVATTVGGKGTSYPLSEWTYHVSVVLALSEGGPGIPVLLWGSPENFDIGRATPGKSVMGTDDGTGKDRIYPVQGVEPGAWKVKNIAALKSPIPASGRIAVPASGFVP